MSVSKNAKPRSKEEIVNDILYCPDALKEFFDELERAEAEEE